MNDLKLAFRQLFKRPGGVVVILATLALIIGTLHLALAVLAHERSAWLPFPESGRLVRLWQIGKERLVNSFPAGVFGDARQELNLESAVEGQLEGDGSG